MFKSIKGVKDILPDQMNRWHLVEDTAQRLATRYGYQEIRIPIFEQTDLFVRSIGGETDVVEKEMYTFPDRDGTSLTLRPEGTAGVVRSFLEHRLGDHPRFNKLYYIGPMFRHERPQAGRFRQFHQFGVEAIGSPHALVDVDVIELLWRFFSTLKITGLSLEINSLGTLPERHAYKRVLQSFLAAIKDTLCQNCQRRSVSNPLRVLDCKVPTCRAATEAAPHILDHLETGSQTHFQSVLSGLETLRIPYTVNHRLVRGLDYYSMTTFEVTCSSLGAQNAIGAGGRYDGLFETLGGKPTPAIGFAVGLERVVLALPEESLPRPYDLVFLAAFGEKGSRAGLELVYQLRDRGLTVVMDPQATTLKSLLKSADRLGSRYTLILGDDEASNGTIIFRDMVTKSQESFFLSSVCDAIASRISKP